ncbi:MAG: hypothetical protein HY056_16585 [Proteobacteria bacterium]|nr:hypothetical protein [Pseudomonadota bacterium]
MQRFIGAWAASVVVTYVSGAVWNSLLAGACRELAIFGGGASRNIALGLECFPFQLNRKAFYFL